MRSRSTGAIDSCVAGLVPPERFDRVADEFEPDRMGFGGGKHVDDAAAHRELPVLVGRILPGEAGVGQQFRDITGEMSPRARDPGAHHQPSRRAHLRQQRHRRDDDPGLPPRRHTGRARGRMSRRVRRHAPVRIDFGATGTAAPRDPLAAAPTAPRSPTGRSHVHAALIEIAVRGHHVQHGAARHGVGRRRDEQRFRRRRQPGDMRAGTSMPLRVMAVLKTARRFREVEVGTVS